MTQHVSSMTRKCFFTRNKLSYSGSSYRHLPTRLLQLCPLRSAFIRTTTLVNCSTHCCSSNKRSQFHRPHHTHTETTTLASHPCLYRIQNLSPHVSHTLFNLYITHVIHGYAMLYFQVQRTPIIYAWGFCYNLHKSEVWQSSFLDRRT